MCETKIDCKKLFKETINKPFVKGFATAIGEQGGKHIELEVDLFLVSDDEVKLFYDSLRDIQEAGYIESYTINYMVKSQRQYHRQLNGNFLVVDL